MVFQAREDRTSVIYQGVYGVLRLDAHGHLTSATA